MRFNIGSRAHVADRKFNFIVGDHSIENRPWQGKFNQPEAKLRFEQDPQTGQRLAIFGNTILRLDEGQVENLSQFERALERIVAEGLISNDRRDGKRPTGHPLSSAPDWW